MEKRVSKHNDRSEEIIQSEHQRKKEYSEKIWIEAQGFVGNIASSNHGPQKDTEGEKKYNFSTLAKFKP